MLAILRYSGDFENMANLPVMFQRVAEAFDADVALTRVKACSESSGSEHSPESSTDLSDLVLSFMEDIEDVEVVVGGEDCEKGDEELEVEKSGDFEKREMLKGLFGGNEEDVDERDEKEKIRREVEIACGELVGNDSSFPDFKRWLMSRLRDKGFDAGEYYLQYAI